ncbi:MAG: hypothetical protein II797_01395 [Clostridia bacterium]|nr:hypothetical protein [Clostridia bacterium]
MFRVSVTLSEDVNSAILNRAIEEMKPRFPTFFVRLKSGFFWYYLEETDAPVRSMPDFAYPLTYMNPREIRTCCTRVLYFKNRIAAEFFHSVTDGTGGLIFLQNLTAKYLSLRYGLDVPPEGPIVSFSEMPKEEELEDSFQKSAAPFPIENREPLSYRLRGSREPDGFRHLTTGIVPTDRLIEVSHQYRSTVTGFLTSVMLESVNGIQSSSVPLKRQKPVKVTVPVNLRKFFPSGTFRNYALALNIGYDPKLGHYSLEETCAQVSHQIAEEAVPQKMAGRIAENVRPQKNLFVRFIPRVVKNVVMRSIYAVRGESNGCLTLSNLGIAEMPEILRPYIRRFDFVIGIQLSYPNNCSVVSYGDKTYINMIRNIRESELERRFFSRLVELGIPVEIESNRREEK